MGFYNIKVRRIMADVYIINKKEGALSPSFFIYFRKEDLIFSLCIDSLDFLFYFFQFVL